MHNNLINHEVVDTFFMSDEQLKKSKKVIMSKGFKKNLKTFLMGVASVITLGVAGSFIIPHIPETLQDLYAVPILASGVVGMKGFLGSVYNLINGSMEEKKDKEEKTR